MHTLNRMNTRPPIERMVCLATLLRNGTPFTLREIAERFEVSVRTATRDLDYMIERLSYEVEWDNSRKTYRLVRAPRAVLL